MVDLVLKVGDKNIKVQDKKKVDPKKIPKRLIIKLITNIDRFKRTNFNQNMVLANAPGENFLFLMKYYQLKKNIFRELGYTETNKALLFFTRNNILRTAVKRNFKENKEFIVHNINFIINELFENGKKLYLGSQPYTIFSNFWNGIIYKTNNPNVLQIDLKLILAEGTKLTSAQSFQLTCDQRRKEIAEDVDLIFNNMIESIKSIGTAKKQPTDNRKIYEIKVRETPLAVEKIEKTYEIL